MDERREELLGGGQILGISEHTVNFHVQGAIRKPAVRSKPRRSEGQAAPSDLDLLSHDVDRLEMA